MSKLTDQEVVKGRWPEAESAWPNGIWNLKGKGAFRLGWDWHEARQHPSVLEVELERLRKRESSLYSVITLAIESEQGSDRPNVDNIALAMRKWLSEPY